ncbi:MAG TPA: hypothetical protein PLH94_13195 [Fimbriimonadaceae bacterium]|nr:hypothetical protein [Fimbriimonadaceae bacterium]
MRLLILILALVLSVTAFAQSDAKALATEKAKLAGLEKTYTAAKAKFTKSAKDAKVKKTYLDAANALADATMRSAALSSKEKYPKALRLFREVLKVDPANKMAMENRDMIEGIYKSMGRPIPK